MMKVLTGVRTVALSALLGLAVAGLLAGQVYAVTTSEERPKPQPKGCKYAGLDFKHDEDFSMPTKIGPDGKVQWGTRTCNNGKWVAMSEPVPPQTPTTAEKNCYYNRGEYSPGATEIIDGKVNICEDNGEWYELIIVDERATGYPVAPILILS
jgi:hypothetical protein